MRKEERTLSVSGNTGHQATGPQNVTAEKDLSGRPVLTVRLSEQENRGDLPAWQVLGLRGAG